MHIIDVF